MTERGVVTPRRLEGGLVVLGVLLLCSVVVEAGAQYLRTGSLTAVFLGGVVTTVPFLIALVGGGIWLSRADVPPERYSRIAGWVLGGFVFFGGFMGLVAVLSLTNRWERIGTVRWGIAVGTGGGALIGVFEARAIEQAVARERTAVRAEEADHRRELLTYLNALLRHEVLNTANVIQGYATLLADPESDPAVDATGREYAKTIGRQADELAGVTKDVRLLLSAAEDSSTMDRMDLRALLRTELDAVADRHEGVETELSAPEGAYVRADDLLRRLFSNLFDNAVVHNDGDVAHVSVSVDAGPDELSVRVADDGPGVPDDVREGLFSYTPGSGAADHGLGLSIVETLANRYGGEVELTETGPDGSVFTVVLPRADAGATGGDDPATPESRPETPPADAL